MTDSRIKQLAEQFKAAIEAARDKGEFPVDCSLNHIPNGCCGDSSDLLAEYLKRNSVETIWYSAQRDSWSHAWLVINDRRLKQPTIKVFSWPEELRDVVSEYGVQHPEEEEDVTRYEPEDLQCGLIIDITGDQFEDCNIPVYVGYVDAFHQTFDFRQAYNYDALNEEKQYNLYQIITKYLD